MPIKQMYWIKGIYRLHETILNVFNKISENPEQKLVK